MFENSFSVGYSPMGPMSINPTAFDLEMSLSTAIKIRAPDKGIRSFLKDTGELG